MTSECPMQNKEGAKGDNVDVKECPIDHSKFDTKNMMEKDLQKDENVNDALGKNRVKSSIPKDDIEDHWVYPSEQMFFNAMKRKGYPAQERDIGNLVTVHNVVNEQCWVEIQRWEKKFHW
ncbi:Cytochrome c/c1 heme-lyase domain-containing protein [Rozella allomycis CSF55]|uniref:Holocytochrome c-type synthase n=1 Tax=Rozella allomycis (strain CSF55) TaxID=988480 RepID=A0A075AYV8_ROZAC|nr:Cytochrome c/c1 heme-lyase domain-containing protein [Rozella allomycis CSF55]|eukprot:EPZ33729.1 Cytochrome c/c1 heme-lyase domain-containing protein [Rozella allomycis CSF55]